MEAFSTHITNASLLLVKAIEQRFSQTEKNATIEIGVVLGMLLSACILVLMYALNRCRKYKKDIEESGPTSDVSLESAAEGCESKDEEDCENAPSATAQSTGAYRSDSDSDDEGQGARVNKEAQKRARKSNGV